MKKNIFAVVEQLTSPYLDKLGRRNKEGVGCI